MELVNVVASDLLFLTVCENSVPHGILYDQHTDFFELIAKFLNIKADDTITHINVGAVIKEVLAAVYEHFKRICYTKSDFALLIKLLLQIGEKRHLFRCRFILDKMLVDALNTFIDNRAFLSGKTVATSDNDLAKRDQKVGLIGDHFHRIAEKEIINRNIHRIQVLFAV